MIKSEIGWLVLFFAAQKRSFESILGKGVYGKKLESLLKETDEIKYLSEPLSLKGSPKPFELIYNLPNAEIDCADWIQDNK